MSESQLKDTKMKLMEEEHNLMEETHKTKIDGIEAEQVSNSAINQWALHQTLVTKRRGRENRRSSGERVKDKVGGALGAMKSLAVRGTIRKERKSGRESGRSSEASPESTPGGIGLLARGLMTPKNIFSRAEPSGKEAGGASQNTDSPIPTGTGAGPGLGIKKMFSIGKIINGDEGGGELAVPLGGGGGGGGEGASGGGKRSGGGIWGGRRLRRLTGGKGGGDEVASGGTPSGGGGLFGSNGKRRPRAMSVPMEQEL